MNDVINAIMEMLHRKGVITDKELSSYLEASYGSIGSDVGKVVSAINAIGKEKGK